MSNYNHNEKTELLQDDGQFRVFIVPVDIMDVPELDIYEQMVYMVLRSYVNPTEPTAFPSYKTISERGRMSRRKAIDAMHGLVDKGLIQKEVRLTVTNDRKIRNTSNLYTVMTPKAAPKHPPAKPSKRTMGGAQRAPDHNQLTNTDINMIDCMGAAAEIAATTISNPSDKFKQEIYQTLQNEVPKNCYMQGIPLSQGYIREIYTMLLNQFANQLSSNVVKLSCENYFNRACRISVPEGVVMTLDVKNPVGLFKTCYSDAIKQYKAMRSSHL